jgi:hypothetical protein
MSTLKSSPHLRLPSINSDPSQEDKIIQCLEAHYPHWVAMPKLSAISGSLNVHTRISALRKKGFKILNTTRTKRDTRNRDSFYRLEANPNDEEANPQTQLNLK